MKLRQHTEDVVRAVAQLRSVWTGIPAKLELAAIFHDLGKAATGFQKSLKGEAPPWRFRHEVLSAAIMAQCYNVDDEDLFNSYLAVLTHHKNLGTPYSVNKQFQRCYSQSSHALWSDKWLELIENAKELKEDFAEFDQALKLWEPPVQTPSPANDVSRLIDRIQPVFKSPKLAIARGALVAADHLASSGLASTLLGQNLTSESLERYARREIKGWTEWSDFQRRASEQTGSAVLVAPTGAGKTEAALLWAITNRKSFERVFYVLPYQVSINAIASRIAKIFPDDASHSELSNNDNVSILHANMDLAYLEDAQDDDLSDADARQVALHRADAARKIYAPIKITTVFQLLHIFFGRKFFEVGFLELTNSIVVFDEIHAYDGRTMGLIIVLLDCLHRLGAKVLIMTATLPTTLRAELCAAARIATENQIDLPSEDPLLSEVRRTLIQDSRKIEEMIDAVRVSLSSGQRVAVVCNTVSKAIKMADSLSEYNPLLVHSRFTLGDRVKREAKSNIEQNQLVIATQVLEVSLDVSFDVMFTELAPADSLLQRFGRVNRHSSLTGTGKTGFCYVACGEDTGSEVVYGGKLLLELTKTHVPTVPLTFGAAQLWIERVYPNGLAEAQREKMIKSSKDFRKLVAELRPMLDPTADPNEENFFDSIQVIPAEMENVWRQRKRERNHTEAKKLVVNVYRSSWNSAIKNLLVPRCCDRDVPIAPFRYDPNLGLLLDQPL